MGPPVEQNIGSGKHGLVLGLLLLTCVPLELHAAPPQYHLVDLSYRITGNSQILDMNNRNQVVGYVMSDDSLRSAFVWRNGVMSFLDPFGPGRDCIAEGINDSGIIVGYSYVDPGKVNDNTAEFHTVRWDTSGKITDLGIMGGYRSAAFDINNKGQIAGYYSTNSTQTGYCEHVFLWENGVCR
jgi:probable HAF family extracellular repeat protein